MGASIYVKEEGTADLSHLPHEVSGDLQYSEGATNKGTLSEEEGTCP